MHKNHQRAPKGRRPPRKPLNPQGEKEIDWCRAGGTGRYSRFTRCDPGGNGCRRWTGDLGANPKYIGESRYPLATGILGKTQPLAISVSATNLELFPKEIPGSTAKLTSSPRLTSLAGARSISSGF